MYYKNNKSKRKLKPVDPLKQQSKEFMAKFKIACQLDMLDDYYKSKILYS